MQDVNNTLKCHQTVLSIAKDINNYTGCYVFGNTQMHEMK